MSPPVPTHAEQPPDSRKWLVIQWLLIFLSFAVFATLRSPVPGVNEPHYLTKARHFWDPAWCSRDPFLQSAEAHYVFYATVGWMTQFLTLSQTAWAGRIIGWGLLAAGWLALSRRLIPIRWAGLWSAWLFLLLASIGNWSGEWVVGGIEAKVISYACAWLSLADLLSGRSFRAAAWAGAATSFHPVVGIWNTAALIFCKLGTVVRILMESIRGREGTPIVQPPFWRTVIGVSVAWTLCAAPGLVPALNMLRGANKAESYAADFIQVYYRLSHHLDPWTFSRGGYIGYATLLVIAMVLYSKLERSAEWKTAARYLLGSVLIAAAGVLIRAIPEVAQRLRETNVVPGLRDWLSGWVQWKPQLAGLLKFYPFRLADVVVPWFATLILTRCGCSLIQSVRTNNEARNRMLTISTWIVSAGCGLLSLCLPAIDRNPSRLSADHLVAWQDACRWVELETPRDALCYATHEGWALKWYASRAEYLSRKDCPQDAAGIVQWNERFKLITRWSKQNLRRGYSRSAIRELRRQTGIDYIIAARFGPFAIQPVYRNGLYQVYRLSDAE